MAIQPTREEARDTGTLDAYAHLYDVQNALREMEMAYEQLREYIDEKTTVNVIAPTVVSEPARLSKGLSIGLDANATAQDSVAIGFYSRTYERAGSVSFGNSATLRQLIFIKDPTEKQDGATKNYVDTHTVNASSTSITVDGNSAKINPDIFSDGLTATDAQVSLDMGFVGEHLAGGALYYDSEQGLMVKVGQGLHIQNDEIDIDQDGLPLASAANRGTVKVGTGLAIDAEGTLSADLSGALKALNYTFTDTLVVNLTGGVTTAAVAYDDIAHKYVAGKEKYEVYKANFTFSVSQAYTAGTSLEFSFTFSYNGANVTATRQTMATVIDKGTGKVVGNYVTKYTTGTAAKYTLTVPVTETIPAKTNLVVLMNYI